MTQRSNARAAGAGETRGTVWIGRRPVTAREVYELATGRRELAVDWESDNLRRVAAGSEYLARLIREGFPVYGVTTGFGDSCTNEIPAEYRHELPMHLVRYHGCGTGAVLDEDAAMAVVVARLCSLAQGYSGVRPVIIEQLARLVRERIVPVIPSEGSVGASGDLTPLSYVAAVLMGEREVFYRGERRPTGEVFRETGVEPVTLAPKEGLALMNGTAMMTGLAALAWVRAEYLTRLATRITAMASAALGGNARHFDPRLFAVKPHAGQNQVADWLHRDLEALEASPEVAARIQDRYSLRCAPHVIGVLRDSLDWMRRDIENELNSANDNPLIDPDEETVYHGGHFYGGHIAFVADSMKNAVANVSDLLDRQLAHLVDPMYNNGLPQNLTGATGDRQPLNHGLKAIQIAASAWTAEALKLTMPASVFSRSTECHNQDKVSMGSISARDALRVLELTELSAASMLMATAQALELRFRAGELATERLPRDILDLKAAIFERCPFIVEDRPLDRELESLAGAIREGAWELY